MTRVVLPSWACGVVVYRDRARSTTMISDAMATAPTAATPSADEGREHECSTPA